MPKSTVFTIPPKNKEEIKVADVAKGVTVISKQRPKILKEVEKLLLIFINEKQQVTIWVNCEKALEIYNDLVKKTPGTRAESDIFEF